MLSKLANRPIGPASQSYAYGLSGLEGRCHSGRQHSFSLCLTGTRRLDGADTAGTGVTVTRNGALRLV